MILLFDNITKKMLAQFTHGEPLRQGGDLELIILFKDNPSLANKTANIRFRRTGDNFFSPTYNLSSETFTFDELYTGEGKYFDTETTYNCYRYFFNYQNESEYAITEKAGLLNLYIEEFILENESITNTITFGRVSITVEETLGFAPDKGLGMTRSEYYTLLDLIQSAIYKINILKREGQTTTIEDGSVNILSNDGSVNINGLTIDGDGNANYSMKGNSNDELVNTEYVTTQFDNIVGLLENLTTEEKSTIVAALNELKLSLESCKGALGEVIHKTAPLRNNDGRFEITAERIIIGSGISVNGEDGTAYYPYTNGLNANEIANAGYVNSLTGDPFELITENTDNLVSAINELKTYENVEREHISYNADSTEIKNACANEGYTPTNDNDFVTKEYADSLPSKEVVPLIGDVETLATHNKVVVDAINEVYSKHNLHVRVTEELHNDVKKFLGLTDPSREDITHTLAQIIEILNDDNDNNPSTSIKTLIERIDYIQNKLDRTLKNEYELKLLNRANNKHEKAINITSSGTYRFGNINALSRIEFGNNGDVAITTNDGMDNPASLLKLYNNGEFHIGLVKTEREKQHYGYTYTNGGHHFNNHNGERILDLDSWGDLTVRRDIFAKNLKIDSSQEYNAITVNDHSIMNKLAVISQGEADDETSRSFRDYSVIKGNLFGTQGEFKSVTINYAYQGRFYTETYLADVLLGTYYRDDNFSSSQYGEDCVSLLSQNGIMAVGFDNSGDNGKIRIFKHPSITEPIHFYWSFEFQPYHGSAYVTNKPSATLDSSNIGNANVDLTDYYTKTDLNGKIFTQSGNQYKFTKDGTNTILLGYYEENGIQSVFNATKAGAQLGNVVYRGSNISAISNFLAKNGNAEVNASGQSKIFANRGVNIIADRSNNANVQIRGTQFLVGLEGEKTQSVFQGDVIVNGTLASSATVSDSSGDNVVATVGYVKSKVGSASGGNANVDLTNYYTKSQIDSKFKMMNEPYYVYLNGYLREGLYISFEEIDYARIAFVEGQAVFIESTEDGVTKYYRCEGLTNSDSDNVGMIFVDIQTNRKYTLEVCFEDESVTVVPIESEIDKLFPIIDGYGNNIEDLQRKTRYVESYTEDSQLHLGRGVEVVEIGRNGQLSVDDGVPNVQMVENDFNYDDTNEIVNKKYIRYKLNELLDQVPEGANTFKKLYDAIKGNTTNINNLRLILDNKFPLDDYDELSKLVIQSNSNDGIIEIGLDGINIGLWDKDINIDITKEWDSNGNINLTVADFIINLINPSVDWATFKIKDFTTNEILFEVKSNGVYSKGQRILDDRDYEIIIEMMENYATYENTYTRDEIDNKLGSKVNTNDVYTKNTIDSLLNNKVNVDNVYTKSEVDTKYQELDNKITLQDIRDTRLTDYLADKDWAAINADSTSGYIRNYLKVGDQLTYDWTDTTTSSSTTYSVENNVLDFEDETYFKDEQGEYIKPSMVLEWDKAITFNIEYSPSQAWLTLTNGLPAGTYCIYVSDIKTHDGWQNVRPLYEGKYLTFTLTKPIPSGGQLRGWNIGTTASDLWGVRTYSAWDNHTLIEGVTFTVNTSIVGTYLGKSWGALNTNEIVDSISVGGITYSIGRINHWERVAYGSNRYKHSVVRRWLNSDLPSGQWYTKCEEDVYEVKSTRTDLLNRNGFMSGLPSTFKNNLKATKLTIHVASVDVSIADDVANEVDIMYDKVFLLTATQMARASESIGTDVVKEGAPYEYYRLLANSQYNNASMTKYGDNWYFKLWTTYRILKRKAINGGYVNYWQSGCRRSNAYHAWYALYNGFVHSYGAYATGVRCLPAFKIGGNRA